MKKLREYSTKGFWFSMGKTAFRREINQDIYDSLLLKEASGWKIAKESLKRLWNNGEFWIALSIIELVVIIYIKLGR